MKNQVNVSNLLVLYLLWQKQKTRDDTSASRVVPFRDVFMEAMTFSFSDELEELRTLEQFDASSIKLLVDSLEQGVTMFPSDEDQTIFRQWVAGQKNRPD